MSDTEKGDEGRSERGWTKCEGSGVFRLNNLSLNY